MEKQVLFGKDAREKLLAGVQKITNAVRVTMGASGKCVLIGEAMYVDGFAVPLPTIVTKDGYNVTKHFSLSDRLENRGALMIKEAAYKTMEQAGDSTTCTCVLAEAIISEGMKLIENGANSQELKKGIDKAVIDVVAELQKMSIPIKGDIEKIKHLATVSANNDSIIGELIASAFEKIGDEGIIDIEESGGVKTEIKIADGYKFNKGWLSPLFINKKEKQICEFENPLILIYDKRITHHTQIQKALEITMKAGKPIVIICEDADQEGLAFLSMNVMQGRIQCCLVTAPDFGDLRREGLEDIALMTGGIFISSIRGIDISKDVNLDSFGRADKVIVSKDETVIIGGKGDKKEIENLLNELRMNLATAKNEEEKLPIEKRIAKLTGGVAVIQVGAATETEMKEKLDRVDDAVRATKSAISEGFVAGGGTAFLRIREFNKISNDTDFNKGQILLHESLLSPASQISINAGYEPAATVGLVISQTKGNVGYNALADKIEDMVEAGIIDSTKALRCALQNAASVAGMLLTSECFMEGIY